MKIELKGWESKGLRCPDVAIDLLMNGSIAPIALIQMPNGTGKTTTLNMLRASMSGEAEKWDNQEIMRYRRPGEENEKGIFSVHLLVDNKPLTFELTLNFEEGNARYRTTSPGSGGVMHGWHPPATVHRFLTENFVRLFVFDGEFADRLLDNRKSEAERAIDALCQLYLLEDINREAEDAWQKASRNKSVRTDQGLGIWQKKEEKLKARIQQVSASKKKALGEIDNLQNEISDLDIKITERMGNQQHLRDKYEEKKREENEAQKEVEKSTIGVMGLVRQPQTLTGSFADDLVELKDQLDKLKLPSSTSSQFFVELIEEAECICGRPMNADAKATIQDKAKRYLGEETSGVLNALKADIDSMVMQEESPKESDLTDAIEVLDSIITKKRQIEAVTRALWDQLIEEGDEELKKWEKTLQEKKERKEKLERLLDEIDREIDDGEEDKTIEKISCLKTLRKLLKEAVNKIAEITGTLELREKTSLLQQICNIALKKSREYIRKELTNECNEKLSSVLARNPLQVESIGSSLKLKNQDGASVGQTLSVGYTFLTNLLHRGKHQFPLVVDSPANPLDENVRGEIAKIIPMLCEQFVGFTISTEKPGFVTTLDENCSDKIKFITLFRKTEGTKDLIKQAKSYNHIENEDCALIVDREYFFKFDRKEA